MLLEVGLDIDREAFREGTWKATPLWYAVARGRNPTLARLLLEHGADVDYRDPSGATALHYMPNNGSEAKHFRSLIRHAARGDIPDSNGATAAEIMDRKRVPEFHTLADRLRTG